MCSIIVHRFCLLANKTGVRGSATFWPPSKTYQSNQRFSSMPSWFFSQVRGFWKNLFLVSLEDLLHLNRLMLFVIRFIPCPPSYSPTSKKGDVRPLYCFIREIMLDLKYIYFVVYNFCFSWFSPKYLKKISKVNNLPNFKLLHIWEKTFPELHPGLGM